MNKYSTWGCWAKIFGTPENHSFIDLKKAFDRVWIDCLWRALREYSIDSRSVAKWHCQILQTTTEVRKVCSLSPVLFNYICGKDNQRTWKPRWQSGDANLQTIHKKTQKQFTPHCRQGPSEGNHFATCVLLTISIFWEAVKNCNNSVKGWRKQLLVTACKSAPTKAKSSSTASSQGHPTI